jgi:nitroreductase
MSTPVSTETVLSALKWRYATKTFDATKKIPDATWSALEHSLVLSPSSFGLQPWKFVVVTNPAVKAKLREKAWNQGQVTDCSHYVVIAAKSKVQAADVERLISHMSAATGAPAAALEGYKGMMLGFVSNPAFDTSTWAAKQGYIALGFLLETAALLGVDACPMEGFDKAAFDEILGLPAEGYNSVVTCALGYRSAEDKHAKSPKVRYSAKDVVKHV